MTRIAVHQMDLFAFPVIKSPYFLLQLLICFSDLFNSITIPRMLRRSEDFTMLSVPEFIKLLIGLKVLILLMRFKYIYIISYTIMKLIKQTTEYDLIC